jgi:methylenetetrahydrofolate dehydrogenase (NADP+) / methenyltetrahydrofolate cyclohydrolase
MIIDGRAIAADLLRQTKQRAERLGRVPLVRAITCAPSPATLSYLRIKERRAEEAGMQLSVVTLPETATEEDFIDAIGAPGADAVIVQLPLPEALDTERIVNSIPEHLDADVLSDTSYGAFLHAETDVLPPVVLAVKEILERSNVSLYEKKCVVVGSGKLVGRPVASWLLRQGAQVLVVTSVEASKQELLNADVVVLGVGKPGLIDSSFLKQGVVLIDAGTSESGGQVVGDAHPSCAEVASVFTPVPGGVGPIAVACLFRNVVTLLERTLQES